MLLDRHKQVVVVLNDDGRLGLEQGGDGDLVHRVVGVVQVDEDEAVGGELAVVGGGVGEEDDVGGLVRELLHGDVLVGDDRLVLAHLHEGVEVVRLLRSSAGNVEDDDGLGLEQVGHVVDLAAHLHSSVLEDKVAGEARLALAANGVLDPEELAVVGRLGEAPQHLGLPGAGDKGRVLGDVINRSAKLLDAVGVAHVSSGSLLGDTPVGVALDDHVGDGLGVAAEPLHISNNQSCSMTDDNTI